MTLATPTRDSGTVSNFDQLMARAKEVKPRHVAVVCPEDEVAITAAAHAFVQGIALPVLVGDEARIRATAAEFHLSSFLEQVPIVHTEQPAVVAVQMARRGDVHILLKGHLRSDQMLGAVLDREAGLRTGRVLADVALFQMKDDAGQQRLVSMGDGGVTIAPTLEQKVQITHSSIDLMHALGVRRPKVAILSATEAVSDAMPSTKDAAAIAKMGATGEFGEAEVFGPLALDNALFPWAAKAKGISHPVAGHADCLVVPNIEAGNLLGKSISFLMNSPYAHIVLGARVPILIPSRVESADDKVRAMALGVLFAAR